MHKKIGGNRRLAYSREVLQKLKREYDLIDELKKLIRVELQRLEEEAEVFRMMPKKKDQHRETVVEEQRDETMAVKDQGEIVAAENQFVTDPVEKQNETATVEDDSMIPLFDPSIHYTDFEINHFDMYLGPMN